MSFLKLNINTLFTTTYVGLFIQTTCASTSKMISYTINFIVEIIIRKHCTSYISFKYF